jgi:hypothetical protein
MLGNDTTTDPELVSGTFEGDPTVSNVTLWVVAKFQVTIPPTLMSTEFGENEFVSVASTVALLGNETVVTVIVVADEPTVTPPAVADTLMSDVPAATPVTRPELLMVAFDVADDDQVSVAVIAWPN